MELAERLRPEISKTNAAIVTFFSATRFYVMYVTYFSVKKPQQLFAPTFGDIATDLTVLVIEPQTFCTGNYVAVNRSRGNGFQILHISLPVHEGEESNELLLLHLIEELPVNSYPSSHENRARSPVIQVG